MRSKRSCKWLILLFSPLPWNIHIKGQYPNCDSIKDFIKTLLCLMLIKFDNLARTESFLPAFLHNKDTCSFVLEDEKLLRWRRVEKVFKTCTEDVFKTSWRPTNVCWEICLKIHQKTPVLEPFLSVKLKRDSGTGVFLWSLQSFYEYIFFNTSANVEATYVKMCKYRVF